MKARHRGLLRSLFGLVMLLAMVAAHGATEEMTRFVFGLPKAELHVHLEGTMTPELYIEIARRNHIKTPYANAEAVRERLRAARDLPSFIRIYEELIAATASSRSPTCVSCPPQRSGLLAVNRGEPIQHPR